MSSPNFGGTSDMMRVQEPWSGGGNWGSGSGATTGGSNQYMSYPALPNFNTPVSTSGSGPTQQLGSGSQQYPWQTWQNESGFNNTPGGSNKFGGYQTAPTMDPAFTNQFYSMLSQLMGQSSGVQGNLLSFLQGGPSSTPGASNLSSLASTGNPISAMPEWQQMIQAQQQNIQQNQANLKEQFAFSGDLQSSPFGTAMSNYSQQTTADQNSLLGQLQTSALENAQNRGLQASMGVQSLGANESQFLNQLFASSALTSPQVLGQQHSSMLGGIGSLLGAGAGIGGSIAEGLSGGGGFTDVLSSLAGLFAT
jgi:hypothetical protein